MQTHTTVAVFAAPRALPLPCSLHTALNEPAMTQSLRAEHCARARSVGGIVPEIDGGMVGVYRGAIEGDA